MSELDRATKRHASQTWLVLVVSLLIVMPLLYVLSCGPVAWIADRTGGNWYDEVYAPMNWLYESVPATRPWLEWYVGLFVGG